MSGSSWFTPLALSPTCLNKLQCTSGLCCRQRLAERCSKGQDVRNKSGLCTSNILPVEQGKRHLPMHRVHGVVVLEVCCKQWSVEGWMQASLSIPGMQAATASLYHQSQTGAAMLGMFLIVTPRHSLQQARVQPMHARPFWNTCMKAACMEVLCITMMIHVASLVNHQHVRAFNALQHPPAAQIGQQLPA